MNFMLFIYTIILGHSQLVASSNEIKILGDQHNNKLLTLDWLSIDKIETVKNFYLFTRDYRNGKEFELLDLKNISSIKTSHFHSGRTYFGIHGFLGNGLESWILELKNKLLFRENCNFISVDWPAGNSWFLPSYETAAGRVPLVGGDTADLLQVLIDRKGLRLSNLHMIGHSLGAHIAGFSGKKFKGRIAKITGLDPAGPNFRNLDKKKRLDKSDAVYVDVMHTNACVSWTYMDCYGITEDIGHTNFWPNGGAHQPFCSQLSYLTKVTGNIGCDHKVAYAYFIESFNYDTESSYFLARKCNSWNEFTMKNCSCGAKPQFMGINSNSNSVGRFYLQTNIKQPFAMQDPGCVFNDFSWIFITFLISIAVLALIIIIGVYYSYKRTNMRYPHINNRSTNSSPLPVNEVTPLLS